MTFQIIRHAFAMIFNNFGQALRVSIVPGLLVSVLVFAGALMALGLAGAAFENMQLGGQLESPGGILLMFPVIFIILVFVMFGFSWIAVLWHRFILLEEYNGWVPSWSGRPIWPYVGRTLWYTFLLSIVALTILSLFSGMLLRGGPNIVAYNIALIYIVGAFVSYLWFRIAVALPAIAIGTPISMGESWRATKPVSSTIFGLVVTIAVAKLLATVAISQVAIVAPLIGAVADIFVQWLTLMVGVSILTTLYGHVIEGRPLID